MRSDSGVTAVLNPRAPPSLSRADILGGYVGQLSSSAFIRRQNVDETGSVSFSVRCQWPLVLFLAHQGTNFKM
jgi:hypothetical protein